MATAVEFTLVPYGADFYDISIINGFNIGIEQLDSILLVEPGVCNFHTVKQLEGLVKV